MSDLPTAEYDLAFSRAITRPYTFDAAAAFANVLAWGEAHKTAPVDAVEQARIDALHKAIAAVSLPRP